MRNTGNTQCYPLTVWWVLYLKLGHTSTARCVRHFRMTSNQKFWKRWMKDGCEDIQNNWNGLSIAKKVNRLNLVLGTIFHNPIKILFEKFIMLIFVFVSPIVSNIAYWPCLAVQRRFIVCFRAKFIVIFFMPILFSTLNISDGRRVRRLNVLLCILFVFLFSVYPSKCSWQASCCFDQFILINFSSTFFSLFL